MCQVLGSIHTHTMQKPLHNRNGLECPSHAIWMEVPQWKRERERKTHASCINTPELVELAFARCLATFDHREMYYLFYNKMEYILWNGLFNSMINVFCANVALSQFVLAVCVGGICAKYTVVGICTVPNSLCLSVAVLCLLDGFPHITNVWIIRNDEQQDARCTASQ